MNTGNKKSLKRTKYAIQLTAILAVFCFVLFNLVFRLIVDMQAEAEKNKADQVEKERIRKEFISRIEIEYDRVIKFYNANEYEKAIEIIKVFNKYDRAAYKDLPEIKKNIRMFYLKKRLEFIPRIHLNEYMKLSREIDIEDDDSTEVFIRRPRYGQYFYTSDFPIQLEAAALSVTGDFSDEIVWKSSIDGDLGRGKVIDVHLSVGEHEITAIGTNGITKGVMRTRIFIEEDPEFLKKYRKKR